MRAGWYERNGKADEVIEVGEMTAPTPAPGEVLVRVHCSGVNPSDVKRREGRGGQVIQFPRVIPHSDGAGIIEAVGEGVPQSRIGERVWTCNAQWRRAFGTAAEFISLAEWQAVKLPSAAGMAFGACLGIPGLTAHRAVFADGPVEGLTVLVTGGAGAVGNYAVQLASWGGARVLSTVSTEAKAEAAKRAGAEATINYRDEDVAAKVMEITGDAGVDRIVDVDFGANLGVTAKVIKQNGAVALYASMGAPEPTFPVTALMLKNVLIRNVYVYEMPRTAFEAGFADIARWIDDGAAANVAANFPLDQLAAAHQAVESGDVMGNVVVDIVDG